jgi:hypothetical protein
MQHGDHRVEGHITGQGIAVDSSLIVADVRKQNSSNTGHGIILDVEVSRPFEPMRRSQRGSQDG